MSRRFSCTIKRSAKFKKCKQAIIALGIFSLLIFGCSSQQPDKSKSIHQWIVDNQHNLMIATDSILHGKISEGNMPADWESFNVVNTKYTENAIGELAIKAGDSSECVVIQTTFYRDLSKKRLIMISPTDSSCLIKLLSLKLDTDSANNFIFGVSRTLLH